MIETISPSACWTVNVEYEYLKPFNFANKLPLIRLKIVTHELFVYKPYIFDIYI